MSIYDCPHDFGSNYINDDGVMTCGECGANPEISVALRRNSRDTRDLLTVGDRVRLPADMKVVGGRAGTVVDTKNRTIRSGRARMQRQWGNVVLDDHKNVRVFTDLGHCVVL